MTKWHFRFPRKDKKEIMKMCHCLCRNYSFAPKQRTLFLPFGSSNRQIKITSIKLPSYYRIAWFFSFSVFTGTDLTFSNKTQRPWIYQTYSCFRDRIVLYISSSLTEQFETQVLYVLRTKISLEDLLSLVQNDNNLEKPFKELKPDQRFVNVLFDEAKLASSLRYTGGHVMESLLIRVFPQHGGTNYIFRVHPSTKLNTTQLKKMCLRQ